MASVVVFLRNSTTWLDWNRCTFTRMTWQAQFLQSLGISTGCNNSILVTTTSSEPFQRTSRKFTLFVSAPHKALDIHPVSLITNNTYHSFWTRLYQFVQERICGHHSSICQRLDILAILWSWAQSTFGSTPEWVGRQYFGFAIAACRSQSIDWNDSRILFRFGVSSISKAQPQLVDGKHSHQLPKWKPTRWVKSLHPSISITISFGYSQFVLAALSLLNPIVSFTLHDNFFYPALDDSTCQLSVFESGKVVEFHADCDICTCSDSFFCDDC